MNIEKPNGPDNLGLAKASLVMFLLIAVVLIGCTTSGRVERVYHSPYPMEYSIAVVPFRDISGTSALDVMAVTDEFYFELQQVEVLDERSSRTLQVVPVNRVLAALTELGFQNVSNPQDVMALANNLGADAVIVGQITKYEPYRPPQIGMMLQLYVREQFADKGWSRSIDARKLATTGTSFELSDDLTMKPKTMVVRMFDAGQEDVIEQIKKYARRRKADETPSGWEKILTSRNYLSFVCHEMVGELLAREKQRLTSVKQGER